MTPGHPALLFPSLHPAKSKLRDGIADNALWSTRGPSDSSVFVISRTDFHHRATDTVDVVEIDAALPCFAAPRRDPAASPRGASSGTTAGMRVQVLGCSHQNAPIAFRERLSFHPEQVPCALDALRRQFPGLEAVLLSTCNRMELYTATDRTIAPTPRQIAEFLGRFHRIEPAEILEHLYERVDYEAIRHLFIVASSLDSMVLGEPQILFQVKQAYQLAAQQATAGPLMHAAFQAALKVARRVASETTIQHRRVSIPSVAVADFARQIFERFEDKQALVIGAGQMAEETLKYLQNQGMRQVTVVNRHAERAMSLARRCGGRGRPWHELLDAIAEADLVISTTGAPQNIVTCEQFSRIQSVRRERPLIILDLAVPRDFEPAIADQPGVYLYTIDDLTEACQRNRRERDKELPAAMRIIESETERFVAEMRHRAVGPIIQRLRRGWQETEETELQRLFHKLPELNDQARSEIRQSLDRLVNKLLHPPLQSLRGAARQGVAQTLLDALTKLFQLKD